MGDNNVVDAEVVEEMGLTFKKAAPAETVTTDKVVIGKGNGTTAEVITAEIPANAIVDKAVAAVAKGIEDALSEEIPTPTFQKPEITEESIMDSELLLSVYLDFAAALRSLPMQLTTGKAARDGILLALKSEIKNAAKMILEAKAQLREKNEVP